MGSYFYTTMQSQCKPVHRRFYMPSEVALHNTPEDCWLSWFGEVYDLSPVLDQNKGVNTKPFIDSAGQDITHWFDNNTKKSARALWRGFRQIGLHPFGRCFAQATIRA